MTVMPNDMVKREKEVPLYKGKGAKVNKQIT